MTSARRQVDSSAPWQFDGKEELEELMKEHDCRFSVICSAVLFDDLFRQVRMWARLGYSATAIQQEIDSKFNQVCIAVQ